MTLVESKQRVADHGQVFTPEGMVEAMLDLVKDETQRIGSRFLEPAYDSCNLLVQVLERKLAAVELEHAKSDFERRHHALLALMCICGIELRPDDIAERRTNLLDIFVEHHGLDEQADLYRAALHVLSLDLVHGDALTMKGSNAVPITSAERGYLSKGTFQRRGFRLDMLAHSSAFGADDSLLAHVASTRSSCSQERGRRRLWAIWLPQRCKGRLPNPWKVIGHDHHGGFRARAPLHRPRRALDDAAHRTSSVRAGNTRLMKQAAFKLRGRNVDGSACIANLSNDEVFTPQEFAGVMISAIA